MRDDNARLNRNKQRYLEVIKRVLAQNKVEWMPKPPLVFVGIIDEIGLPYARGEFTVKIYQNGNLCTLLLSSEEYVLMTMSLENVSVDSRETMLISLQEELLRQFNPFVSE